MKTGKMDWKGMPDSTPSSSTERDPMKQPEPKTGGKVDWRGLEDGTPSSSPDREKVRK